MALFDPRAMLKAAGVDVNELEARFKQLQETVQAGYVAFVAVQATVLDLKASNERIEAALTIMLADRNAAQLANNIANGTVTEAELDELLSTLKETAN
jgi:hypothetical protein